VISIIIEKVEFNRKLGQYIKRKRGKKKWSQAELAAKLGNNFQNVSRIERGEISPTLYWCSKLAEAFDMELHNFIKNALKE